MQRGGSRRPRLKRRQEGGCGRRRRDTTAAPNALGEDLAAASQTSTICIMSLVSLSLPNSSLDAERFRPGVDCSASTLS